MFFQLHQPRRRAEKSKQIQVIELDNCRRKHRVIPSESKRKPHPAPHPAGDTATTFQKRVTRYVAAGTTPPPPEHFLLPPKHTFRPTPIHTFHQPRFIHSTKTKGIMKQLDAWRRNHPDDKIVLFSTFTKMLDPPQHDRLLSTITITTCLTLSSRPSSGS
jgi:hypothetical protein